MYLDVPRHIFLDPFPIVPLCKTIMADSTVCLHYYCSIVQELIDVLYSRLTV